MRAPLLVLGVLMVLAGCGSEPLRPLDEWRMRAQQNNQRAAAAVAAADYDGAIKGYRQALDLYRAIDDVEGMGTVALNLAQAHRLKREPAAAEAALDTILGWPELGFADGVRADAAYRRAVFRREQQRASEAQEWLAQARRLCGKDCTVAAGLSNLEAGFALERGERERAVALAQEALSRARDRGQRVEQANAERLLGEIAWRAGDAVRSRGHYESALALDKIEALPVRIAADLLALARATQASDAAAARQYLLRARAVAEGAGERELGAQAEAALQTLRP